MDGKPKFDFIAPWTIHHVNLLELDLIVFKEALDLLGMFARFKSLLVICKDDNFICAQVALHESLCHQVIFIKAWSHFAKAFGLAWSEDSLLKLTRRLGSINCCANNLLSSFEHVTEI